ncbi:class I SAM-dependent methyltransferase [Alcaligenes sp. RM2]|uniref:class I SAM-dependent methyltransferase n=1 Tax=Alcaligenes TaxID=507 RepID=UPI0002AA847D|nr:MULTISPECIES: class I SAM-dependent methyltransferase [Alcaligenes]EKU31538.1 type 12 methyltransferase [Alcaligenes sp. HPC1271]UTM01501.1 class I SAM-dependent methyltransferase [Alcaligenes sp. NLF5-7]HRO18779.1 class I SAM-dependent methyltransferase [Alcaligenes phenolicus]HRP14616.1 class I SAM-dependent methyltransferase [Alcaligenes phenolicus]
MMNNRYGKLASLVYHLDKPVGRSFGDVEYYLERLQGTSGPILEPAVGTGRILIPLLQAGLDVNGFDLSQEMLDYCQRELELRSLKTTLQLAGFTDFIADRPLEAIVVPAGSFQLLDSFEQGIAALSRFHASLKPGGRLLLDLDPVAAIVSVQSGMRTWSAPPHGLITLNATALEKDYCAQVTREMHRYELWEHGVLLETQLEQFSLRWWGVQELRMALEQLGFGEIVISGGYQYGKTPQDTDGIISFEARKL